MNGTRKYRYNEYSWLLYMCFLICFIISACKTREEKPKQITNAFYYWKSVYDIPDPQRQLLDSLNVNTIYVKYFDVDWDNNFLKPLPKATLRVNASKNETKEIIPCVFITNTCILKLDSSKVEELSKNIVQLISKINEELKIKNSEIQIDYDWTASTAMVYFKLLDAIKNEMKKVSSTSSSKLSATIRLYQVKYLEKTGIPPVDRGMLMCYNMGNLTDPASANSILEVDELKKYISYLSKYPLDLDVALPIFEWVVLFREHKFTGLIQQLPKSVYSKQVSNEINSNRFQIISDTIINGYDLKKGDILRIEKSDSKEILKAGSEIRNKLATSNLRLALFHLDSITLSKYAFHEFQSFFNSLN